MNINDLPKGSYSPVQPQGLNVNNLPQGSYTSGASTPPAPTQQPNLLESLWHGIVSYGSQVKNAATQGVQQVAAAQTPIPSSVQGPQRILQAGEQALSAGAGIAQAATSPIAPILAPVGAAINAVGNKVGDIPAVQKFANSQAGQTTSRVAQDLSNAGVVAGTIAGAAKIPEVASATSDLTKQVTAPIKSIPDQSLSLATNPIDKTIVDNFTKAIKPSVAGKQTLGGLDKYNTNVVSAVKTIADNKENLSFNSPEGEPITGRTPKSPIELSQAIDQTKQSIFKQYDALAQQAGESGAQISADPVVKALDEVINNRALQITHPEAVTYAKGLQKSLADQTFDPQTTQDIIKNYNSALDAFYRNPSYDNASRAAIEAGVVAKFRESLDNTIQSATGDNYQALKNQYGALSSIEKDVAKRAVVLARQSSATGSGSGLADYAQVFAGGDMVHGILSLNPALFAGGAAKFGLTRMLAYLKSPDRAIGKMFEAANSTPAVK